MRPHRGATAWGLSTPAELDWRRWGLCKDPATRDRWSSERAVIRGWARHVCQEHCPVLAECRDDTEGLPRDLRVTVVLAGVAYSETGRPCRSQPKPAAECEMCQPEPEQVVTDVVAKPWLRPHGTPAAAQRHRYHGEPPCRDCKACEVSR